MYSIGNMRRSLKKFYTYLSLDFRCKVRLKNVLSIEGKMNVTYVYVKWVKIFN